MSNLLNFNNHSLFKQPLSRPIFYYEDARDAKKHYQEFENDNIYDFQYEALANQDIAIDLLHAGILADREIYVNSYKKAAGNSGIINEALYDNISDASKNILRKYGIYLDVSNNYNLDVYYLFNNTNIAKYDEIVSSYPPDKNIIYRIYDNKIYFNNNALPIGVPQHRKDQNNHLDALENYKGFDISGTIYKSIFTVGDKLEFMHDTEYYKNQTGYGRKTIKRLNLDTDIANSDIIIADYYWTDDEGGSWPHGRSSPHNEVDPYVNGNWIFSFRLKMEYENPMLDSDNRSLYGLMQIRTSIYYDNAFHMSVEHNYSTTAIYEFRGKRFTSQGSLNSDSKMRFYKQNGEEWNQTDPLMFTIKYKRLNGEILTFNIYYINQEFTFYFNPKEDPSHPEYIGLIRNYDFIAGIQGTSNMILDPYNDNGKLFSNIDQTDTANVDFSGWELFTDREAAHEHYTSIIPFNTRITVAEPEHLLFQSSLNDIYKNYQVNQLNEVKVGSHLVAGYNNYEQRIKANLELYMIDPHKNLILKGNNYFINNRHLTRIHGVWDKTITQTSNFDMQEFLYYFTKNSTTVAPYIWDHTSNATSWVTHDTNGLDVKVNITAPDLTDNNSITFKIPNYQASQIEFNKLNTMMYNPDNPRSPFLTQENYTAADVSNGTFVYNTFNKFYPRAEPLVEMYIKDVYRYDSKFNTEVITLTDYSTRTNDPEPTISIGEPTAPTAPSATPLARPELLYGFNLPLSPPTRPQTLQEAGIYPPSIPTPPPGDEPAAPIWQIPYAYPDYSTQPDHTSILLNFNNTRPAYGDDLTDTFYGSMMPISSPDNGYSEYDLAQHGVDSSEDLEDRYNDILQKEQANYDSALIYKNDLQSWNQYNDPDLGVFSFLSRPGSNYQQNLDIWEDYYNDDMQRHNVDMAIWNEYLEKTEYPENVASWDNGQPVMNSYSSDSSPWQPPSIELYPHPVHPPHFTGGYYQDSIKNRLEYETFYVPRYNAELAVWNIYNQHSRFAMNYAEWSADRTVNNPSRAVPDPIPLPHPDYSIPVGTFQGMPMDEITYYQMQVAERHQAEDSIIDNYNAELAVWLDYSNDIVFTVPHYDHPYITPTSYQQLAESWQTYDSNIIQYNNYLNPSVNVTSNGTTYQNELLLYETYLRDLAEWQQRMSEPTQYAHLKQLPKVTREYEEPIYFHNEREALTNGDISFVFNLNGNDNQYNRLYRNSYLNYKNQTDISYSLYDSNTVNMNTTDSIGFFNKNTLNKHSGNLTIGSFIPQENNNNNFDSNHPDWETKGKEVARYALLYANDHRIEKPTLKPEYHGYYWKMTNYQGWTNEIDISNSTELSSMIFHYERENIGIYRKELYYYENNDPDNKTNWTKWQIDDAPTFNNYDKWVYDQKQDIIHSSLVLCDYNNDIFLDEIIEFKVIDNLLIVLSSSVNRKFLSIWNIETNNKKYIEQVHGETAFMDTNKLSNNEIEIILTRQMRIQYKIYNTTTENMTLNENINTSGNSNHIEIFNISFIENYFILIFESNQHTNNSLPIRKSDKSSGGIVSEICNDGSRIFKNQTGNIYSTKFAIYITETDLTLWNWSGTTLVNKINFIDLSYPYTKNIGTILTPPIKFQDMYSVDESKIYTLMQINNSNEYKFLRWNIIQDINNSLAIDISDTSIDYNDSIYTFNSDISGIKIIENKYFSLPSTNKEYLFFNIVNGTDKNLLGIDKDSQDWDNISEIELTNVYDFSINLISAGTNITEPSLTENTRHNYSILYTTKDILNDANRVIYKIPLSDYYDISDASFFHLNSKKIEDTQIDENRKIRPNRKGFTRKIYDSSGLFIAFANGAEMPSPTWIFNNFGLDWRNSNDWDDLLDFYHSFTEPELYIDNSPGSEYYINNILDNSHYTSKKFQATDQYTITDLSLVNIGQPLIHWSGSKGEDEIGGFPVLEFNGRAPETVYELGHLDKIVNKLNATNGISEVWNNDYINTNPANWRQNGYNKRGRSQHKRIINSEPWKLEKTLWWEVKVPDNIEELTGITYANALQDKKYYIQFAKDYPEYGFNKDEFIHWDNQSNNYEYFNEYAKDGIFYFPLKTDRIGGYPINRKIVGEDFLSLSNSRNVNSREYLIDSSEPATSSSTLYRNEITQDKDGNDIDKVFLVTQYISAFLYPKNDISNTELTIDNVENNMEIYYFTNLTIPAGTIKDCHYYTGTFDYIPDIKKDVNNNDIYLNNEIRISGWKHYDHSNEDFLNFKEVLYDSQNSNIAYNIGLDEIITTGKMNETQTELLHEGLRTDKVVYEQITKLELNAFKTYQEINGEYQYNRDDLDISYNNRRIFYNVNGTDWDTENGDSNKNYKIKYDISYGWSIYNTQDDILYNDLSNNRTERTVNLQPPDRIQFTTLSDDINDDGIGYYNKILDFERVENSTPKTSKTMWNYLNQETDISYSNAEWTVDKIEKGMVFISYQDPNNIDTIKPKYTSVISNVYEKVDTIPDATNIDICNVYWIDEPVSFNDGNGYNSNFDNSRNAQIPLVDLSINNIIYTIENKLVGMGGFKEMIDMSNELLTTSNYGNDTTITPDSINAGGSASQSMIPSPYFNNIESDIINYYSLTSRPDNRSNKKSPDIKNIDYLSSIHDKLFYDHDWTRIQSEDNWGAVENEYIASNQTYLESDLSFETVFAVLENNIDNSRNVLFTDLSDITFEDMNYPFKREQFTYEFPYLYYEYENENENSFLLEVINNYGSLWDVFIFRDLNNTDGLDISSDIQTNIPLTPTLADLYGKYDFRIDLLECQVVLGETTASDISNARNKFRNIKELGQTINEETHMIKAYLYGKHIEGDRKYLVFKYKEPATYAENPAEDKTAYRQYTITDGNVQQKALFPSGEDEMRSLIGFKDNFNTTGVLTINSDIAMLTYIPIKINIGYKYNTLGTHAHWENVVGTRKIINTISNGTSVYLLKLNTLENNRIVNTSSVREDFNIETVVIEEIFSQIDIPNQPNLKVPRFDYEYTLGSKVRPIKFLIDYNAVDGLAGSLELVNQSTTQVTSTSVNNFKQKYQEKEIITYNPLNGSIRGSWSKSKYTSEGVIIDENSFINYVNPDNAHDNNNEKNFLYLLKSKPISSQYGSKVHNYFYEPIEVTEGSEAVGGEPHPRSAARSVINIISPIDSTDGSSNIAEDLNGVTTFGIDDNGVFNLKYTPKTLGASSFYSIPYTLTRKSTGAEIESAITINLVAKYLIELGNFTFSCSDISGGVFTFKLPYKINDSAITFSQYNSIDYIYNNIQFQIYSDDNNLDDIGKFIFDPNGTGTIEEIQFIPSPITLSKGSLDEEGWDPVEEPKVSIVKYKIIFDGEEYTNRNNNLTLNITNTYNEPVIDSSLIMLDLSYNASSNVRFTDVIFRDEEMDLINIQDIDGPYNGSITILERINTVNPGYKTLQYTPNDGFLGMDYVFFTVVTNNARDQETNNLTGLPGTTPNRGYLKFHVFRSVSDAESVIDEVETVVDEEIEEDEDEEEEICPCPKEVYKPMVTATVDPRITLANWVSSRARNLYAYPKKQTIITQSSEEVKVQNARKIVKIKNF